ncbi:MAG: helix-turn-helix transcriptional regulator [Treponemataceae bacterium]
MEDEKALTPLDVAAMLRIAKNTVYELVKRGELRSYRVGKKFRFDRADIETYKRSMRGDSEADTEFQREAGPLPAQFVSSEPYSVPNRDAGPSYSTGFVLCGQDIILDTLAQRLEAHPFGCRAFRSYLGSYNGLYELYMGSIQAASAHLWDGDTGEYNIPFLRRLLPGIPIVVVRLASRKIGFYVPKGNPKKLRNWEDLFRKDLSMVNRERGSGVRVLIDERLRLMGIPGASIPGYDRECSTHLAVASLIARRAADFAVGNEKTSQQIADIDFVPLQEEKYDLVFRAEDADRPLYKALVEIACSADFREELEGFGGYGTGETGLLTRL